MECEIINNIDKQYNFKEDVVCNIISTLSKKENQNFKSLNIIVSDDNHLNNLKKEYFNIDHFTDIISFNLEEKGDPIEGEIYISMDRIEDNANKFEVTMISTMSSCCRAEMCGVGGLSQIVRSSGM